MKIREIVKKRIQETDIPELQPTDPHEASTLRQGLDILGNVLTAKKKLSDPRAFADEEIKNALDPDRQNSSIIRRIFKTQDREKSN